MDKSDNRHRLTVHGMSSSPPKSYHEVNGSGQELGRKSRTKKKIKKHQSQSSSSSNRDWLNEPARPNEIPPGSCWMPQGQQRLFTAISDPAVCGYPMSLSYSIDQFSLPMFPVYHASPVPQKVQYRPSVPTIRKPNGSRNRQQQPQGVDEYTSLPPVNLTDFESDHQRRFSDPGLANGPLSDEECGSGDESDLSSNESQLADRLSQVIKDNKRLETELQDAKLQLQELKLEVTELKQLRNHYEPGVVSDLVREVREAMKIHQEAFISRMQMSQSSMTNDKLMSKDCEDLKKKLHEVTSDRDMLHDRLSRLEEQVKTVMVHNSVQQSNQEELVVLEQEKLQLRRELQEAVDARKVAEAKIQNFEQLISVLQKKMPNGIVMDEKNNASNNNNNVSSSGERLSERVVAVVGNGGGGVSVGGGPSSGESLMSSLGSGSLHSPHVTMSGPVTDL